MKKTTIAIISLFAFSLVIIASTALANIETSKEEELSACIDYWTVRLTYEVGPDNWTTHEAYRFTTNRSEAEAARDNFITKGYVIPTAPGEESEMSEKRVAPGNIKYASVKKVCCKTNGPIDTWWCRYFDGLPPPAL